MKTKYIIQLALLFIAIVMPGIMQAQDVDMIGSGVADVLPQTDLLVPPSNSLPDISVIEALPPIPGGGDVTDVPIDGGLSVLLASGAAYAVRRMCNKK